MFQIDCFRASSSYAHLKDILPEPLHPLEDLAMNLWWSWNGRSIRLMENICPELWEKEGHNPVKIIRNMEPGQLDRLAEDKTFIREMMVVYQGLNHYLTHKNTWYNRQGFGQLKGPIAYFSAEFGIHESFPIYAGGLGILAGDHLKSASDVGIPMIGVGLLYRQGYLVQRLDKDGQQHSSQTNSNFRNLPTLPVKDHRGCDLMVKIEINGRMVHARLWYSDVGRIKLLMLDTDHELNEARDRKITKQLYGGDNETRLSQEILLGMGGIKALRKLDVVPDIYHINEGHAAFLNLERLHYLIREYYYSLEDAVKVVNSGTVFTTHTPVPAGHDKFPQQMMQRNFKNYCHNLNIEFNNLMKLGQESSVKPESSFNMTILALRTAKLANGVSKLHSEVSQAMFQKIYQTKYPKDVPITYITNGVHPSTWIAEELKNLYDRYLPYDWYDKITSPNVWSQVNNIPNEELWDVHCLLKNRLVEYSRKNYARHMKQIDKPIKKRALDKILNPDALTIGFARRFAPYKRATLLLKEKNRLINLLNDPEHPLQFIFSGKAHPRDLQGQSLLKELYQFSKRPKVKGKIIFLENYNIDVARFLVQGVDIWLNTPIRPMEASGTSGEKAGMNGILNFSILDGWWPECAEHGKNGWNIGTGEATEQSDKQDELDAGCMYDVLEGEIIPLYFQRSEGNVPHGWVQCMKESIKAVTRQFNTHRMVKEYFESLYIPAGSTEQDVWHLGQDLVS